MKCPSLYEHTRTFRSRVLDDERGETTIHFRTIRVEDEQILLDFFHSHTDETIYYRYGMMVREMSHLRALELVRLDGYNELALIGLTGLPGQEWIVAIGRYALEASTNLAEVAFVVHEQYRGMGIATHLLLRLVKIVRSKGFAGIMAQALLCNVRMLEVLDDVFGPADQTTSGCGETTLVYRFKPGHCSPLTLHNLADQPA